MDVTKSEDNNAENMNPFEPRLLYLHVPFCERKAHCAFESRSRPKARRSFGSKRSKGSFFGGSHVSEDHCF